MAVSSLGQIDLATGTWAADNALFLKVFSGEVLTAFDETNVFKPLHMTRSIQSGKSAQFPVTWKASAAYQTLGALVTGSNQIRHAEQVINIDDKLISDVFVDELDELKNHYDIRGIYSKQLGEALARTYDQTVARVIALAANASSPVTGGDAGTALTNASFKVDGDILAGGIFSAAQALDEHNVPASERYCALLPAQYYLLVQTTKVINRDWGGAGAYADGEVLRVAGVQIVKSNNMPDDNYAGVTGERNTYVYNGTNTAGIVWHKSAAGTVSLKDMTMSMTGEEYKVMYQGTLMVANYAIGHGILRPEAAVELATA